MLVLFYAINLIVVYSRNENKPQLLASFESVAKQLLIPFGRFLSPSLWQFSSLKKKHVISLNYDLLILQYIWKNATHPLLVITPWFTFTNYTYQKERWLKRRPRKTRLLRITLTVKSKFADPLETFRLMETFVLGKILNPIYQVVVSDSTKFEDLAVLFFTLVVSGHKRHV